MGSSRRVRAPVAQARLAGVGLQGPRLVPAQEKRSPIPPRDATLQELLALLVTGWRRSPLAGCAAATRLSVPLRLAKPLVEIDGARRASRLGRQPAHGEVEAVAEARLDPGL